MNLTAWLNDRFREWEKSTGRKQPASQFARWLGVKQPTLNRWMTGDSTPEGENLRLLARKLGPEIYLVVGQPVPADLIPTDSDLAPIAAAILKVPLYKREAFRKDVAELLAKYIREEKENYQP